MKRVAGVSGGVLDLRGDNSSASTDSRTFGLVPVRSLRGRVVYRYAPAERGESLSRALSSGGPKLDRTGRSGASPQDRIQSRRYAARRSTHSSEVIA